eukprot:310395-Chlamydomonas_euryale.AAC.1
MTSWCWHLGSCRPSDSTPAPPLLTRQFTLPAFSPCLATTARCWHLGSCRPSPDHLTASARHSSGSTSTSFTPFPPIFDHASPQLLPAGTSLTEACRNIAC